MRWVLLLSCLSGCLTAANTAGLAATSASLVCDYGQTLWHAQRGWKLGVENNHALGPAPSPAEVSVYFATATFMTLALAQAIPARYRPVAYVGITAIQAQAIHGNMGVGTPLCGL